MSGSIEQTPRVVSLIASATEIVHALGAGHLQVARSHECDWPPAVADLPALTRAKFRVDGASREIDKRVRSLVEQGLAVYDVDAEALKAVSPDVILTQDQCEVCAVSLADVERAVCTWTDRATEIVSLRPHRLEDVYRDIRRVAAALGRPEDGDRLVGTMEQRIAEAAGAVRGRPRPSVAFIEWIDPPMSGGHWMPELMALAGGRNLFGSAGGSSPWITWEEVAAADPDVIVVAPCGFDIARTRAEMGTLDADPRWRDLRAVREGRVFLADGNAYFNRPGPRLADTVEILVEVLHPGVHDRGHGGRGYVRYGP